MFRPPFLARVAVGTAVYALEETRRLPTAAMNFPITAVSRMLQTTMHAQQFVTSLALKGDAVFDRLAERPVENPEWATFDDDVSDAPSAAARTSRFDNYSVDDDPEPLRTAESFPVKDSVRVTETNGHARADTETKLTEPTIESAPEPAPEQPEIAAPEIVAPEIAVRYDYANMTLAQLRARLRMLTVEDLASLLEYEQHTRARAPFVTMLTNRIATVRAQ
ncbi:lipid droplet-associated protein [Nocardia sp. CNY236]|uniref:lipid droplet-associated protein n=1 Tax=Nocardia sp. CNY236 TaxID=1169152 RepID=UPI0003FCF4C2|nr:lipid droplet-associated protein [Nocardia sp. CNY236]